MSKFSGSVSRNLRSQLMQNGVKIQPFWRDIRRCDHGEGYCGGTPSEWIVL